MTVQATLLVCDDSRWEITGKGILVGIYLTDIAIPIDPLIVHQLVFFLIFEGDWVDRPKEVTFELTLPGQPALKWPLPFNAVLPLPEGRTRFLFRQTLPVFNAVLRPGHIVGRIIYDSNELTVGGPWIVMAQHPIQQETVAPDTDQKKI